MTVFDFFNQIVGFLAQTLPVVLLSLVFFPTRCSVMHGAA